MPRFVFKLQPVLDQRQREERGKQLAVAQLERERLALESRIRSCQSMMSDERRQLSAALSSGGRVDLRSVRLQAGASLKHNFDAQRASLELAGVYRKLIGAREELARASSRRKAVELLRDQQRRAFEAQQDRMEALDLDEMSVMRHGHDNGRMKGTLK